MAGLLRARNIPSQTESITGSTTLGTGGLAGLGGYMEEDIIPAGLTTQLEDVASSGLEQLEQTATSLEAGALQAGAFGAERQDILTEAAATEVSEQVQTKQTSLLSRYLSDPEQYTEEQATEEQAKAALPLGGFKSILGLV